jgi:hypothetical protein
VRSGDVSLDINYLVLMALRRYALPTSGGDAVLIERAGRLYRDLRMHLVRNMMRVRCSL